jgi:mono/diheme cytochrome c family protein
MRTRLMKQASIAAALFLFILSACSRKSKGPAATAPTAYGTALVEVSGGKQVAPAGATMEQPLVVQVNDKDGTAVVGAPVWFGGPSGVTFGTPSANTDSSGQVSTPVTLGANAGRYQLTAYTRDASGKTIELKAVETALDYQQVLGGQLNLKYCDRCHNPESTAERVSNYDNLTVKPHPFSEGDTLNKLSDADITSLIEHGGAALGRSAEMPPWGYTLSKSDIQALVAYIRAIADPPYRTKGLTYAKK